MQRQRYIGAVTGACEHGTGSIDCSALRLRIPEELWGSTCQWAFDGECEHPGAGAGLGQPRTDTADYIGN